MSIQWTEDLATGITDIDDQHQELIKRLNDLMGACVRRQGTDAVLGYMEFLMEYVAYHFAAEEREMHAHRYPGLTQHEGEHEKFKKDINSLSRVMQAAGASPQFVETTLWASAKWLIHHVKGTDREMAAFLKQQGR